MLFYNIVVTWFSKNKINIIYIKETYYEKSIYLPQ